MELKVEQKFYGPRTFFACVLSIFLIQILALDMYTPALPSMQDSFDVSELYLNRTVFSFLFTSTIAMIVAGPVSDRFGRKPTLVAGCAMFVVGSLLCAAAPSVEVLIAARAMEAVGYGTSATLAGALVKDVYEGDDLKLAMTLLQSLVILGPVAAPFMGSLAITLIGWRGIFWALTAGGVLTLVLALLMTETYDASARSGINLAQTLSTMFSDARSLVSDKRFTSLALFIGVTGIPFFAFIAVSPYILLDDFQVGYLEYSFIYAGACFANMLAPFVYMKLSKTWDTQRIMRLVIILTAAAFAMLATIAPLHPALLLVSFVPYALAEGIARPAAYMVLLDQEPDVVGTASAIGNFSYGVITAVATVAAALPWPSFMLGLVVLTAFSAAGSFALYRVGIVRK